MGGGGSAAGQVVQRRSSKVVNQARWRLRRESGNFSPDLLFFTSAEIYVLFFIGSLER